MYSLYEINEYILIINVVGIASLMNYSYGRYNELSEHFKIQYNDAALKIAIFTFTTLKFQNQLTSSEMKFCCQYYRKQSMIFRTGQTAKPLSLAYI